MNNLLFANESVVVLLFDMDNKFEATFDCGLSGSLNLDYGDFPLELYIYYSKCCLGIKYISFSDWISTHWLAINFVLASC